MNDTERPVVLVSGGSRGLGAAVVEDLLARGYRAATFSRSRTPFVDECERRYGDAFLFEAIDATDHASAKRFVLDAARRLGRFDALVNNAGMLVEQVLPLMRPADVRRVLELNVESAILLTQACVRVMLTRRSGSIVNVSSIDALRGHAGVSVYSASKAALIGFTQSLARELGPRGIRVNAVAPGFFESEMVSGLDDKQRAQILRRTPLGRLGAAQDLAGVVHFLISDDSRFVTGQTLVVDGGLTC